MITNVTIHRHWVGSRAQGATFVVGRQPSMAWRVSCKRHVRVRCARRDAECQSEGWVKTCAPARRARSRRGKERSRRSSLARRKRVREPSGGRELSATLAGVFAWARAARRGWLSSASGPPWREMGCWRHAHRGSGCSERSARAPAGWARVVPRRPCSRAVRARLLPGRARRPPSGAAGVTARRAVARAVWAGSGAARTPRRVSAARPPRSAPWRRRSRARRRSRSAGRA